MKINKLIFLVAMSCGSFIAINTYAADLMDVYKQAVATDPTFKAAKAKFLADKQKLPISRADLLPQLGASGGLTRQYNNSEGRQTTQSNTNDGTTIYASAPTGSSFYSNNINYSLKLTQPIFNFGNWAKVWGAQAEAKGAEATFLSAEEELLVRITKAYFDVLLAKDVLHYTKSNKVAVGRLLNQAKYKYEVGLIAITDFEDARAKYDEAVAEEITAINDLSNKFEQLNEITGVRYLDLDSIKVHFPLLSPQPADIEAWVKAAEQQNFELIAARYAAIVARENIKLQNAGHLPVLSVGGSYGYAYNNNPDGYQGDFNRSKTTAVGVELSIPIFQGGKVIAVAKQANYQYEGALAAQHQTHRSVISQTRQTYLGVLSSISKIKADQQAIKSAQNSLRATEASYTVGTRTMADVLKAQTDLYHMQKNFADDEYKYIVQLLGLKKLTGILAVDDLIQINSWLAKKSPKAKNDSTALISNRIIKQETLSAHAKPSKIVNTKAAKSIAVAKNTAASRVVVLSTEEVKKADVSGNLAVATAAVTQSP